MKHSAIAIFAILALSVLSPAAVAGHCHYPHRDLFAALGIVNTVANVVNAFKPPVTITSGYSYAAPAVVGYSAPAYTAPVTTVSTYTYPSTVVYPTAPVSPVVYPTVAAPVQVVTPTTVVQPTTVYTIPSYSTYHYGGYWYRPSYSPRVVPSWHPYVPAPHYFGPGRYHGWHHGPIHRPHCR